MGKTNLDSYKATFPDRHSSMVSAGKAPKDIASIVTAYNKGMLVTKIMERAMVPTWILNQDVFQSAINTQYELMTDTTVSDKVRSDAANSLLTHLKKPEIAAKAEIKIDIGLNDGMAAIEQQLINMSRRQLELIEHDPNVSANDIASMSMKTVNP
jgi:translation initiation factor 2 alpha subunit (eIF-2alpha)